MPSNPFTSPTISGYNTSPPSDDGSQTSANRVEWAKHKTKLSDPVKTLAEAGVSASNTAFATVAGWLDGTFAHNFVTNGDFRVAQRGTTFTSASSPANSDDTYLLDRWILLSNGNDTVDVSQETSTVPTGSHAAIKLDVETANRKFGIIQIIEARDAKRLAGQTVSLSFKARITGTSITKLRAAVLSWVSTEDSVTSDVVSAWNDEDTNPTLVSNWTAENTAVDLTAPTTSYQTYEVESINVDSSSIGNVAIFIWCNNTDATVGDFLYITDVMLHIGADALSFQPRPYAEELVLCRRRFRGIIGIAAVPAIAAGVSRTTTIADFAYPLNPPMAAAPTLAVSDVSHFVVVQQNTTIATTNLTISSGADAVEFVATVSAGLTAGEGNLLRVNDTRSLFLDAEL